MGRSPELGQKESILGKSGLIVGQFMVLGIVINKLVSLVLGRGLVGRGYHGVLRHVLRLSLGDFLRRNVFLE